MVRKYTDTFGDGARILAAIEKSCNDQGLPWDSIFGSMGDADSPMREAAVAAWKAMLFTSDTVLVHHQTRYEARRPVVPMSFRQVSNWCTKNGEQALSLRQVSQRPKLQENLARVCGTECRILDVSHLQGNLYHIASILDPQASRHISSGENLGPNDIIVIQLDPPGCPLKLAFGTEELPVFEVVDDITFEELHNQLRWRELGLAQDTEFLDSEYSIPDGANVFVRGGLMFTKYSRYSGAKELQNTIDSMSAIIYAGSYVIGRCLNT